MKISLVNVIIFVVTLTALSSRAQEYSSECSGRGILQYGRCLCRPSSYGNACECSGYDAGNHCIPSGDSNVPPCYGRGTCVCGLCECDRRSNPEERVNGQYCECDNFSCERVGGLICSGSDHGRCVCGMCVCNGGYTGAACDASDASASSSSY